MWILVLLVAFPLGSYLIDRLAQRWFRPVSLLERMPTARRIRRR
jgi:hypothetical protein